MVSHSGDILMIQKQNRFDQRCANESRTQRVSISSMTEDVLKCYAKQIETRNIHVDTDLSDLSASVYPQFIHSAVRQLIENAIDASATEVFVDIEKGGKGLVRVTDNGCGMKKDDAFLCLERHATSKVKSVDDLFTLHTMGFRGEALPAIASVSRLRLTTRSVDDDSGWQIYAEGGTIRQAEAIGAAPGTVVEVRNLFFNTPGRRKFLRKEETEFGHIADVVSRLIQNCLDRR